MELRSILLRGDLIIKLLKFYDTLKQDTKETKEKFNYVFMLVLERGADLTRIIFNSTLFFYARTASQMRIMIQSLKDERNGGSIVDILDYTNSSDESALMIQYITEDLDAIELLIKEGVNLHYVISDTKENTQSFRRKVLRLADNRRTNIYQMSIFNAFESEDIIDYEFQTLCFSRTPMALKKFAKDTNIPDRNLSKYKSDLIEVIVNFRINSRKPNSSSSKSR